MLQNYLLTAYRNIIRDRLFSLINVFGLAIGFAACLLIFLFLWSEINYDRWVPDSARVYRVESTYTLSGRGPLPTTTVPAMVREGMVNDFGADVEMATHLIPLNLSVRVGDQIFNEQVTFVDQSFLSIFPLTITEGSQGQKFANSLSIMINETMARKYFGNTVAVGKTMSIETVGTIKDYTVVSVFKDLPDTSHMTGDIFSLLDPEAFETATPGIMTNWFFPSTYTYIKMKQGATPAQMAKGFGAYADRNDVVPKVASYAGVKPHEYFMLHLINVRDIHLDDRVPNDMKPHGSMFTVYAFAGIAFLLLFIGSVNFINLSTARSLKRAKEVALRKTLGAKRSQLITQFMMEAVLTVTVAAIVALALVKILMPFYNEMLNLSLSMNTVITPMGALIFLVFIMVVSVLSGAYPAFYVSRARPGDVLHSNKSGSGGGSLLRTALVTLQFSISIGLLVATSILYQQTEYVTGMDLGYDTKDIGVLRLPFSPRSHDDAVIIKEEIERIPGVKIAGISGPIPTDQGFASFAVFSDAIDSTDSTSMQFISSGYGYFETYGIKPIAGRLFSKEYGTDMLPIKTGDTGDYVGTVILNESALKRVGYPDPLDAIGKVLRISQPGNIDNVMTIVGVVPDVHYGDARLPMQPRIFYYLPTFVGTLSFKIDGGNVAEVRSKVREIWNSRLPDTPINLQFVEDLQGAQYDQDRRQGRLLAVFSILTIVVAGFGLYGLAAFMAVRRTKEVGIRKVLGASNMNIIILFVWSLSKPILVANIIAWPVAWYLMNDWLARFTYRIDMTVAPFIVAGVIVTVFGVVTVAGRTYNVARTHPSKALRAE